MRLSSPMGISTIRNPLTRSNPPDLRRGISPWEGIVRVGGPRSLDMALMTVAAHPNTHNDVLIVGAGRSRHVLARFALRAGLVDPKLLVTNDCEAVTQSVRVNSWRYVVIDCAELMSASHDSMAKLDQACCDSGTTLFACDGPAESRAYSVDRLTWSCAVQSLRLVEEMPSHANGVFELRVVDNVPAPDIVSNSVVRVLIPANGRIGLADSGDDEEGPLILELRQ
ncbi:hypothetical protein AFC81_07810 [Mycobacterium avium subsp. paratuberculosis]|uniref:Uncharacterized protein n=1 Tax=Mycolicibacterium paratuberculosis (strain ATCC BAA-968 / K-10) TaxID=262316 RepID=Q742H2_MYCPA|nr:hypothetical protein MAP_0863 [Mycobacterium avium subsp. paratuberculosis K-10]AGL37872.1 hypothetical protein MAP4_2997 [Mycobacterium avium subsp. paratuberculosis MAP4]ANH27683.1 hypothetical protein A0V42_04390 [Mycobacterium avium subsp. paratuberculosis]ASE16121.1 hypothetical protein CEP84_21965 [Mycobacterium avium subsp. paratuberculosis]ASF95127.1 hypothetical protein CEG92_04535 [Mycobacterium avium subsp. paratuberculosis]